ncbi:MAG TPA: carbamoyltransferase HypF [Anaerovoracaceae bacterium]|nr:carbamoyltransferase HypF [Anaerovoracaceae bacterium]
MSNRKTVKIKIWGIVQGVGFRPFAAKLADRFGMKGEVLNIGGLVDLVLTDTPERIEAFIEALKKEKPLPAEIVHMRIEEAEPREFGSFTILDSDEGDDEAAMIPADLSICPDCLAEVQDPENPRYLHPFISCMACGPRYTIIDKIPYDRENTTMTDFSMCEFCRGEYTDREDRRYHAQTISCHDCGPMLEYRLTENCDGPISTAAMGLDAGRKIMERAVNPVMMAVSLINDGKIIALKGVGGYNFVCSPFDEAPVKTLRRLKIREEKPFAVMFRDMEQIREYCHVIREEEELLLSGARPIVLLERKRPIEEMHDNTDAGRGNGAFRDNREICPEVYKSSRYIGAFLPSMGVQFVLVNRCGPLIMTSANLSDMPIIKDDKEMFELQASLAPKRPAGPAGPGVEEPEHREEETLSAVFYNERKIRVRLDDSVARVIDGQPQMIRRSKGYAPVPLYINNRLAKRDMILAAGGQLKSSFSLSKGPFAYVSQYFGDLDTREAEAIYKENVERMAELFRIRPGLAVCDLHPLYFTTKFAEQYAREHGIELLKVQHHHAHTASVMAEHDLQGPVIGVSFDGTGYGTDGAVWGGEFLICRDADFRRAGHLEYVKLLGGDSSMKEGWKSALSYIYHCRKQEEIHGRLPDEGQNPINFLREPDDSRWPTVKAGISHGINTIDSSSMGRLFDAIAAFTGIHDDNRYEGECAILLENAAATALDRGLESWEMAFDIKDHGGAEHGEAHNVEHTGILVSAGPVFRRVEEAMDSGADKGRIALGFHCAVTDMILKVCKLIRRRENVDTVALTGGVFQNKILMERTLALLRMEGFRPYYNISVGPNDGGICLGQNYIGMKYLTEKRHNDKIERQRHRQNASS